MNLVHAIYLKWDMHLVMGHVCFGKMTPFQKDDLPLIEYEHLGPLHTNHGVIKSPIISLKHAIK